MASVRIKSTNGLRKVRRQLCVFKIIIGTTVNMEGVLQLQVQVMGLKIICPQGSSELSILKDLLCVVNAFSTRPQSFFFLPTGEHIPSVVNIKLPGKFNSSCANLKTSKSTLKKKMHFDCDISTKVDHIIVQMEMLF